MQRKKMTARTLPALKYANEAKVNRELAEKGKEEKESKNEKSPTCADPTEVKVLTTQDVESVDEEEFVEAKKKGQRNIASNYGSRV